MQLLFIRQHLPASSMLTDALGSEINDNISVTIASRVQVDQPAQLSLSHAATTRCKNLLLLLCNIAGSNIPASSHEATAMESHDTIGLLSVRNTILPSHLFGTRASCPKINITRNMLENQTGARWQSSNEQLYRLGIKHICLDYHRRVRSSFVPNE